jgi:hypothetical protein
MAQDSVPDAKATSEEAITVPVVAAKADRVATIQIPISIEFIRRQT